MRRPVIQLRRAGVARACLRVVAAAALLLSAAPRVAAAADGGAAPAPSIDALGSLPLGFAPNVGQADPRVDFLARGAGYGIFLAGGEAVLDLRG